MVANRKDVRDLQQLSQDGTSQKGEREREYTRWQSNLDMENDQFGLIIVSYIMLYSNNSHII